MDREQSSGNMPDAYDRKLAGLHDLPDVIRVKPATIRTVPALGVGGSQVFVVQTYRQAKVGDTVFLEVMGNDGGTRIVLPPSVTNAISRQRDALTKRSRSRAAVAVAEDRKARGIRPGFLKRK